eukprot:scaffold75406_cov69-Phaeocystis_antarctica.AAC.1
MPGPGLLVLTAKHLRQESRGRPPRCLGRDAIITEGRVRVEPLRRVGPRVRGAAVGVELARVTLGLGLGFGSGLGFGLARAVRRAGTCHCAQ